MNKINEKMHGEMVSVLRKIFEHRQGGAAWGEVKLCVQWRNGQIVDYKFIEETIRKAPAEKD